MKVSISTLITAILAVGLAILVYETLAPGQPELTHVSAVPYPPPALTPAPTRSFPPTWTPVPTWPSAPTRTPFPVQTPTDPLDVAAIRETIELSYELQAIAARSFDTSQFPNVYANDPTVNLTEEQTALVATAFPYVRGRIPDYGARPGMLDFWRVWYAYWQLGAERFEQQQRGMTVNPQHGPIGPPRRTDPIYKASIRFDDFQIIGDRAEAVIDSGMTLKSVFLFRTKNGWRIVGIRPLSVHG